MYRLFRPSKAEPRIHAVIVALESSSELVRLKAVASNAGSISLSERASNV